jgi:hypothetical protein
VIRRAHDGCDQLGFRSWFNVNEARPTDFASLNVEAGGSKLANRTMTFRAWGFE